MVMTALHQTKTPPSTATILKYSIGKTKIAGANEQMLTPKMKSFYSVLAVDHSSKRRCTMIKIKRQI